MNLLDILKEKYINDSIILSKDDFCNIYKYPFLVKFQENNNSEFLNSKSPTIVGKTLEELINNNNNSIKIFSIFPIVKTNKNPFLKKITVGRTALQDIIVQNMAVSKFHSYFHFDDDQNYFLVDNNSTNGTFVNGNKIEAEKNILLKDKDEISFSDSKFIFYFAESAYTIFNNKDLLKS